MRRRRFVADENAWVSALVVQSVASESGRWLLVLRRYLLMGAPLHLLWEVAQLPLYTLWREGTAGEIAFAVAHCTGGDVLIATMSLVLALLLCGDREWPARDFGSIVATTILFGATYTIFSEWLNIEIRQSWAYAASMPTIPGIGTGLSPLAQWVIVPWIAFWWAARRTVVHW